jgi:hypothetical protein
LSLSLKFYFKGFKSSTQYEYLNILFQDVIIEEKVDVIISEWMGYMLLYEVSFNTCIVWTTGLIPCSLYAGMWSFKSSLVDAEYAGKCNFCQG